MGCCPNCFNDNFLKQFIEQNRLNRGTCAYCLSKHQPVIEPSELRDFFELLAGVYEVNENNGEPLIKWFNSDWELFSSQLLIQKNKINNLFVDIFSEQEIINKKYIPVQSAVSNAEEKWVAFRKELKHFNRFFPREVPDLNRLKTLFDYLLLVNPYSDLYRARIQVNGEIIDKADMGRPPKEVTTNGRANPAGIPYLYLASDIKTAITEIRPHPGEQVSVAFFNAAKNLKLADLRWPKKTISPFNIGDESEIVMLRRDINFLCQLGEELTKTVIPRIAHLEYLPSQYICEYIKHCGFHGVIYRSSVVESGTNIALFDESEVSVANVRTYIVNNIQVDFSEV